MTLERLENVRNRCHSTDWNTETANIIYTSSSGYTGHLAASLYSLLDHNRNIPRVGIYILFVGMNETYLERLAGIAGKFCRGLYATESGNLRERFDHAVDTGGFNISAAGCLFAPKVLPDSVRRTLYLDYDTIVNEGIRLLYETELGNHLASMMMEPAVYREMEGPIGVGGDKPYYSFGVLLIDSKAWRNQGVLGQLLELYRVHQNSLFACDQDTINGALRGRIATLPVRYNHFTSHRYSRYGTLAPMCGAYRVVGEDRYRQAREAPVIIHYLGGEGPWIAGNHGYFRRLYEYYLGKTPWKGTPKQEGKRLYTHM